MCWGGLGLAMAPPRGPAAAAHTAACGGSSLQQGEDEVQFDEGEDDLEFDGWGGLGPHGEGLRVVEAIFVGLAKGQAPRKTMAAVAAAMVRMQGGDRVGGKEGKTCK